MNLGILALEKLGPPFNEAWRNEVRALSHALDCPVLTRGSTPTHRRETRDNYMIFPSHLPHVAIPGSDYLALARAFPAARKFARSMDGVILEASPNFHRLMTLLPLEKCLHNFNARYWIQKPGMGGYIKHVVPRLRGILVSHEGLKRELVGRGVPSQKMVVAHPGIELSHFSPNKKSSKRSMRGPFRLLFASAPTTGTDASRSFRERGLTSLLDALASLPASANVHLTLIWRNRFVDEILDEISVRKLENRVTLRNEQLDSLADPLSSADALVLVPSSLQNMPDFPSSVMEAASMGKPVMVSSVLGIAEDVSRYHAGVVADPNPESIRQGILALLKSNAQFSHAAEKMARDRFDIQKKAKIIESFFSLEDFA